MRATVARAGAPALASAAAADTGGPRSRGSRATTQGCPRRPWCKWPTQSSCTFSPPPHTACTGQGTSIRPVCTRRSCLQKPAHTCHQPASLRGKLAAKATDLAVDLATATATAAVRAMVARTRAGAAASASAAAANRPRHPSSCSRSNHRGRHSLFQSHSRSDRTDTKMYRSKPSRLHHWRTRGTPGNCPVSHHLCILPRGHAPSTRLRRVRVVLGLD